MTGPVTVRPGAELVAIGASATGPLVSTRAAGLELTASRITGPVAVVGGTGPVVVASSEVTGPVTLVGNQPGGDDPVVLSDNRITGPLFCHDNQPAPVDLGLPNVVEGPATGQCADR